MKQHGQTICSARARVRRGCEQGSRGFSIDEIVNHQMGGKQGARQREGIRLFPPESGRIHDQIGSFYLPPKRVFLPVNCFQARFWTKHAGPAEIAGELVCQSLSTFEGAIDEHKPFAMLAGALPRDRAPRSPTRAEEQDAQVA